MDPVEALTEIAELLERDRASRYKSKAFRTAAQTLTGLSADERADVGRLRSRKGIGDSTYKVIAEALSGRVPAYLAELRERVAPVEPSGLRMLLRGDLHAHSDWSDGLTPIDLMVDAARTLGHEYLALTDHSPRLRVARGLSAERLREQLDLIPDFSDDSFTLLSGIEVDILDDGSLDQTDDLLRSLDVVVASAHSTLRMERASDDAPTRRCGIRSSRGRPRSRDRATRVGVAGNASAVGLRCASSVRGVRGPRHRGRDQLAS